jgi:hypothetical protein
MYPHLPKGKQISIRDELQKLLSENTANEANRKKATDLLLTTEAELQKEKRGIFMDGDKLERLENLRLDLLDKLHKYGNKELDITNRYYDTVEKVAPEARQNYFDAGIPVPRTGLTPAGLLDLKSNVQIHSLPTDDVQYISYLKKPTDTTFHASSLIRDPKTGDVEFFNPTGEPLSSLQPSLQKYVQNVANGHKIVECNMASMQLGGSCASFTMHRLSQAHVPYQEWITNLTAAARANYHTEEEHVLSSGLQLPTEPIVQRPEVQKQYKNGGIVFSYGRVNGGANK